MKTELTDGKIISKAEELFDAKYGKTPKIQLEWQKRTMIEFATELCLSLPTKQNEQPQENDVEWISVEDRSPHYDPVHQTVFEILIASSNGRQYTGYSVTEYGETRFYMPNGRQVFSVTHWMPLPTHPEELSKHDKQ